MKPYAVSDHAIKRATERLGVSRKNAKRELVTLMQKAQFQGVTKDGERVFDHHNRRVRFIVAMESDKIITIYNMRKPLADVDAKPLDEVLPPTLLDAVKRKAKAKITGHKRELRKLEIEVAEAELLLAQKRLNRLKTNNPRTKAAIDRDITEIASKIDANKTSIGDIEAAISQLKAHA
ncbi:hypothetical protein [Shouchella clausii]|uniref:hypothetical protein n=1 Tax=Shouchella clausii TaxID=79880 RepID=UPI00226CA0B8|nr:hypothetical protein [Shouchella clausii]MCY1105820.1 hypothetical protein [Shouchella clausii]